MTFTSEHGSIVFPKEARESAFPSDGLAILDARAGELIVRIEASTPEQREYLKGVATRRLDRFAFREVPLPFASRDV
ncbi:DUF2218 domain-containing protein [Mesorhizobium sp.]|uniref:DUF2218 domain-containing protein n=1 Tax=Mesorhizobium sp. TaxID=1871066 RepID=UPI0025D0723C|nr:DUF2218 domain-containing protein [Mesorhizobium sp.]